MSAHEDAIDLGTGVNGRFRVVGIRHLDDLTDAIGFIATLYVERDEDYDIVVLEYDTHIDARLGADGLRVTGFTIAGIEDMTTGKMVDSTPLSEVPR